MGNPNCLSNPGGGSESADILVNIGHADSHFTQPADLRESHRFIAIGRFTICWRWVLVDLVLLGTVLAVIGVFTGIPSASFHDRVQGLHRVPNVRIPRIERGESESQ